jgi:hypothetical protein
MALPLPNGGNLVVVCTTNGAAEFSIPSRFCSSGWASYAELPVSEASSLDFEALGITSASVSQVFAWGFGALLAFWLIGFTVGSLIRTLNLFR